MQGGGVGATPPPWRFQTKGRRASRKKPADCSRRDLAIGGIIFGPRSTFDPVMTGQRSNFRKNRTFSTLRNDCGKTIRDIDLKPSPSCSLINSRLSYVYLDIISLLIAPLEAPEVRKVTSTAVTVKIKN